MVRNGTREGRAGWADGFRSSCFAISKTLLNVVSESIAISAIDKGGGFGSSKGPNSIMGCASSESAFSVAADTCASPEAPDKDDAKPSGSKRGM